MRDRETDSWWSIMKSESIGGELESTELTEMPWGEKIQFRDWVQRHPDTLVLSVDGAEHVDNNPYDNYFTSGGTFRDLEVDDDRLPAKAGVYAMWIVGHPYAVPHERIEGGRIVWIDEQPFYFHRPHGASFYASTAAYRLSLDLARLESATLLEKLESGDAGFEPLEGFDTYWYTWVAVNEETRIAPREP